MQYSIHGSENTLSKTASQWVSLPRVWTTLLKPCWDHLDIKGSRHLMKPGDYLKRCPGCTEEQMLSYQKWTYYTYYTFHVCLPTYLLLFPIFLAKYKVMKRIWQSIVNVDKKVVIHSPMDYLLYKVHIKYICLNSVLFFYVFIIKLIFVGSFSYNIKLIKFLCFGSI